MAEQKSSQYQYNRAQVKLFYLLGSLDSIKLGHSNIHKNNIRFELFC